MVPTHECCDPRCGGRSNLKIACSYAWFCDTVRTVGEKFFPARITKGLRMHLSSTQLATLKGKLEEQQRKLRDVLASMESTDPTRDNERTSDNAESAAEATESTDLDRYESLERESRILLTRVEEALSRIDDGTYGHTADGKDIPFERLSVDPTATTLVGES